MLCPKIYDHYYCCNCTSKFSRSDSEKSRKSHCVKKGNVDTRYKAHDNIQCIRHYIFAVTPVTKTNR